MIKEPIIVAIDPGTTIGVAIINFSGDLIYVNSKREMKKEDVINIIISNGNPLLFATDKAKIPKFVSNIAASFSGHVFQIQEDLKYLEKKKVLESFFDKSALSTLKLNSHEFDSLASAYYVFNKLEDKLNKISLFFSKNNVEKENFLEFLTFAIKNPGINFSNILEKISKKSFEDKKQNHSYAKPIRKSNNYTKYQNTITLLTKKNYYLEKKISNLKKKQNSKTPDDSKSSLEVMSMIYKKNQSDSTINMLLLFLFRIYFFENNLLEKINKKNPKNILCVNLDGFERIEFCLKELKENFSKIEKYNLTFSLNNLFNYKSQIPIFISNLSEKNYKEVK
jgi:predicted RNase H-like nuclease (RuvC/YqgF family)